MCGLKAHPLSQFLFTSMPVFLTFLSLLFSSNLTFLWVLLSLELFLTVSSLCFGTVRAKWAISEQEQIAVVGRQLLTPRSPWSSISLLSAGSTSPSLVHPLNAGSGMNSSYSLEGRGLFHILFKRIFKMQYPKAYHTTNTLLLEY